MTVVVAGSPATPIEDGGGEPALWLAFKRDHSLAAREKLFDIYSPLARSIARRQKFGGNSGDIEFPDLVQCASAGLLEALDSFDPTQDVPFKAFARRRIRGSVLDGIGKTSEFREQVSFRNRMRAERTRSLGVENPDALSSDDAMKALIDLTVGLALGFMLEEAGASASKSTADRRPNAYESLAWKEMLERLSSSIGELPAREKSVVRQHYLNGLTFEQIGQLLSVTKGRVSQIHKAALGRLRERLLQDRSFKVET